MRRHLERARVVDERCAIFVAVAEEAALRQAGEADRRYQAGEAMGPLHGVPFTTKDWIAAAGLDVFEHEPQLAEGLRQLDNVFLLPHLGTATVEDRTWMTRLAVDNAIAALRGERVPHPYPLPDVD